MAEDTKEQQEAALLQAKDVRIYMPPSWLTRRFFLRVLFCVFILGPIPTVLFITGADQIIRNKIDDWMSDPDLYDVLALRPDEYRKLPVHWRQALAEIAVRDEAEDAVVQELVSVLNSENIMLIDRLAPYVSGDFIVRDANHSSQHPMPDLSLIDFAKLEELGILQSVQTGLEITIKLGSSPNHQRNLRGTTMVLVIQGTEEDNKVKLPITRFTEPGHSLMRLLRIPSDIRYFKWLAEKVEQSNVDAELWAIGSNEHDTNVATANVGRIQRDTVPTFLEKQ